MSILNEYQEVLDELDGIQIQEYANNKDKEIFEYQAFVQEQMRKNHIKSISEMDLPQRGRFFKECEELWEEMKAKDVTPKDLKLATNEKPSTPGKGDNSTQKPKKLKEEGDLDEFKAGDRLKRWMGINDGDADERNPMAESWTKKQRSRRNPRTKSPISENIDTRKIDRKIDEIESLLESDKQERTSRRNGRINETSTKNPKDLIGKEVTRFSCGDGTCTITCDDVSFTVKGMPDVNLDKLRERLPGRTIKKARLTKGVLVIGDTQGGIVRFGKDKYGE